MGGRPVMLDPDQASMYLKIWADWRRQDNVRLGFPRRAAGFGHTGISSDFQGMCEELDNRVALAADAVIRDLPPQFRSTIIRVYETRRARLDDAEDLLQIHAVFLAGMQRRGFL